MSKKLLSVVLALALALSCFAVSAFAIGDISYEAEEDVANYTQAWTLESTNSGNTYTVNVKLTANYGVGPIQFEVLKTVNAGSITLTGAVEGDDIPDNWMADVSFSDASGKVAVIPNPDEDGVNALDASKGVIVATLTYTVSDDAVGSIKIDVADAKSESNPGGTLIAARMSDGNVVTGTALVGQTVSAETATITIGSAAVAPTLVAIDGTLGVIDTSRTDLDADAGTSCDGYLYGWNSEGDHSVDELFEVVGDGTINIVANAAGHECGTGTIVEVLDLDGNVVASYVVIIFGDVNGDSYADSNDASNIESHENYDLADGNAENRLFAYLEFAADVNLDGSADSNDASNIESHENYDLQDGNAELRLDIEAIVAYYAG